MRLEKNIYILLVCVHTDTNTQTTGVMTSDSSTQCCLLDCCLKSERDLVEEQTSDEEDSEDSPGDSDFFPSQSTEDSDDSDLDLDHCPNEIRHDVPINREPKYIVFLSALEKLLSLVRCSACGGLDVTSRVHMLRGTMVVVQHIVCDGCDTVSPWNSQPYIGARPAGNVLLSAGLLFTGASATKTLRVLTHMGVAVITPRTFFSISKTFSVRLSKECGRWSKLRC